MINIRLARPADVEEIEIIIRNQLSYRNEPFDSKRFDWGMIRRINDPLQRHGFFVAEESENIEKESTIILQTKIIGIIFAELRVDPFGRSKAFIKQLLLPEKYHNMNIGQKMLTKLVDHLKEMDIQILQAFITPENENIFQMYSSLNFNKKYTIMELNFSGENH